MELTVDAVLVFVEDQHADRFRLRVNDPVFGNAGLGVLAPLRLQVPGPVLFVIADDFDYQVSAFGLSMRIRDAARLEIGNVLDRGTCPADVYVPCYITRFLTPFPRSPAAAEPPPETAGKEARWDCM